ncbi:MAG: ABC transporter substrate-binding protein [Pelagibacteraceae bacterium]|nr:ABC transporter substrate-binding protein [Pelagibacteraceae bacterium]HJL58462.1 ABC transporter substrate-binding protein [Alphaproteobacteria bacterium]|tara:strand:- start:843 stop:1445 length:603 start_codon:yes stop_codon:yes gene_type:complete
MNFLYKIFFIFLLNATPLLADEASDWLKKEIDNILDAYKDTSVSKVDRFNLIEDSINNNFAGAGISKFVAGKSWFSASKETKKEYVKLFKRHLALNIASIMQGYSYQEYVLINSKYDEKNKVSMIDMEIHNDTGNLLVTWRVKKSKDRYFVIDLIVADISLVVTKRSEFNSKLKKVDQKLNELNVVLRSQNESSYSIITN